MKSMIKEMKEKRMGSTTTIIKEELPSAFKNNNNSVTQGNDTKITKENDGNIYWNGEVEDFDDINTLSEKEETDLYTYLIQKE